MHITAVHSHRSARHPIVHNAAKQPRPEEQPPVSAGSMRLPSLRISAPVQPFSASAQHGAGSHTPPSAVPQDPAPQPIQPPAARQVPPLPQARKDPRPTWRPTVSATGMLPAKPVACGVMAPGVRPAAPDPQALPTPGAQAVRRGAPTEQPAPHWVAADVAGGLSFAVVVYLLAPVVIWRLFFHLLIGRTWTVSIMWECVNLLICIVVAPLLANGVRHTINWSTTLRGLALDWPELMFAFAFFYVPVIAAGAPGGVVGPALFSLSVGFSEEMLFRVLILGWLITRMSTERAVLLSAFIFGIAHLHELSLVGLMNIVPQFMGGIVLGAIYLRTRNPLGGVIAHTLWDWPIFMAYGLGVSGGSTEAGMPSVLWTIIWGLFGVYGLYLVRTSAPAEGRVQAVAAPAAAV